MGQEVGCEKGKERKKVFNDGLPSAAEPQPTVNWVKSVKSVIEERIQDEDEDENFAQPAKIVRDSSADRTDGE